MISLSTYVNSILEKKGWTRSRFARELNFIEKSHGLGLTARQDVTNILNGGINVGAITLAKWEVALGLPEDSLMCFAPAKITRSGKQRLKEFKKMIRS